VANPDGTTTEYVVRKTPGKDGGWSRMVITKDAQPKFRTLTAELDFGHFGFLRQKTANRRRFEQVLVAIPVRY
jgi:hypothetical protein